MSTIGATTDRREILAALADAKAVAEIWRYREATRRMREHDRLAAEGERLRRANLTESDRVREDAQKILDRLTVDDNAQARRDALYAEAGRTNHQENNA